MSSLLDNVKKKKSEDIFREWKEKSVQLVKKYIVLGICGIKMSALDPVDPYYRRDNYLDMPDFGLKSLQVPQSNKEPGERRGGKEGEQDFEFAHLRRCLDSWL